MNYKKITKKILLYITLIYLGFGMFLFLNQKSMLYYPDSQDFNQCNGFSDYEKLDYNGTRFYLKKGTQNKIIVYYHGNAGSACDRSSYKYLLEESSASVMFVEYSGYSNDDVKPSKKRIIKDVENLHEYILKENYETVTVYGQSIGAGAASYHTYLGNVEDLILVTPFSKLDDVVGEKYIIYPASILLREKYDNAEWLKNYHGRLLIVHGNNDRVIPHKFSQELFQKVPTKNKSYVMIEGMGHNDISASSLFEDTILRHMKSLRN